MSNHNNNHCQFLENQKVFVKEFQSLERFESEIYYNHAFSKTGFRCPKILDQSSKKRQLIMEFIDGKAPDIKDKDQINECIKQVSLFFLANQKHDININSNLDKDFLFSELFTILSIYFGKRELLDSLFLGFKDTFIEGIFKDSKISNWMLDKNDKLYLLDFDYVRPAHFLSDLAQMISYILLEDLNFNIEEALHLFLTQINHTKQLNQMLVNLLIMIIYSNEKKKKYIKNLNLIKKFERISLFLCLKIKKHYVYNDSFFLS